MGRLENAVGALNIITQFKSYISSASALIIVDAGCLQHAIGGDLEEQDTVGDVVDTGPLVEVIKTSSSACELWYRGQHDVDLCTTVHMR